jgi:PAS domain S-box-containing protein
MSIYNRLEKILHKKALGEFSNLADWRNYYLDLMLFLSLILIPIALAVTIPAYIAEGHYEIIACEIGIVVFLLLIFFIRNPLPRGVLFFLFFSIMILTFFTSLGPLYARPGWLVLSSVAAALLLGPRSAIAITGFNAIVLTILYLFIGPHLNSWAPIYSEPVSTWIIFVVNISLISLVTSLPASLLLTRLTISFSQEIDLRKKISQESETLQETNIALQKEIVERKRIEEAIRASEERSRLIAENAKVVIWMMDLDFHYTYISPYIKHNLDYTPEEYVLKPLDEVLTPSSLELCMQLFAEEMEEERKPNKDLSRSRTIEVEHIHRDGRIIWAELNMTFIRNTEGNAVGILGITQDITERKHTEEEKKKLEMQLIQTQKMEALGRFAGGIAHDLNNLLYPIIIDSEILLEESVPNTILHQSLHKILNASYRQRDLIRQILSFSRRSEQRLIPIRVTPALNETINLLRSSLPSAIKIRKQIDIHADTILADPTQIQQVIMNLFMNAADAIEPKRGTIEVKLENAYIESSVAHPDLKTGQYLTLIVKDTGHGMMPEVMDKIFEPFFTTKEIGKGSGMGLSVVHGILKIHGGSIEVESEPGKGSKFTVLLPITDEEIHIQSPSEKALAINEKIKVLLVDDEEIILSSVQNALKRLGYDVVAVKDPVEALKLFKTTPHTFDLVITDLTMPQITGVELAKKLIDIKTDIPIILCTGFNDVIQEDEAKAIGIRELLLKPPSKSELKTAIIRALEN